MQTLIVGANGQIGKMVCQKLKESDDCYIPVAMIRDKSQADWFTEKGIRSVEGNLERSLDHLIKEFDAIVFTAGSGAKTGPEKTITVDCLGAVRTIEAAERFDIKKYVMVSAMGARDPEAPSKIQHYNRAKHIADIRLQMSTLNYTIIRPGKLTNDPGSGKIIAKTQIVEKTSITREDVAQVICKSLQHPGLIGVTFDLLNGDKPIDEALDNLA